MKWLILLFVYFSTLNSFSQENKDYWFETQGLVVVTSFQNEDIFAGVGFYFKPWEKWLFEGDFLLGIRRTFFQQSNFWWVTLGGQRDFLKSEKMFFGPSAQLGTGFIDLDKEENSHNYYDVRLGYYFSVGNKFHFFQSSYYGIRQLSLNNKSKGYFFPGYSFQMGLKYDL
ncbi:MAG: hypothetical protein QNK75_00410 [Crocinitomicaceae bacterium]